MTSSRVLNTVLLVVSVQSAVVFGNSTIQPSRSHGRLTSDDFLELLLSYLRDNLTESGHRCQFDKANLCAFRQVTEDQLHQGSWSFLTSLAEFTNLLQKTFVEATNAEAGQSSTRTNSQAKQSVRDSPSSSWAAPKANYFPCATAASPATLADVPTARDSSTESVLEMHLPWIKVTRLPLPSTPPLDATEVGELLSRVHRSAEVRPLPITSALACLGIHLRFPAEVRGGSRFTVHFGSLIQTLHSNLTGKPDLQDGSASPLKDASDSTRSPPTQGPPSPHRLPVNTWIHFTAPIHLEVSAYPNYDQAPVALLGDVDRMPWTLSQPDGDGDTWAAVGVPLRVQVKASRGVCIDDFRLEPFQNASEAGYAEQSHCQRQLTWPAPDGRWTSILLDRQGNPLPASPVQSAPSPVSGFFFWSQNKNLSAGASLIFSWVPFSGSLILALSATMLFLCLCLAISISVMFARRKASPPSRHRRSSRPGGARLQPAVSSGQLPATNKQHNWLPVYANSGDSHFGGLDSTPQCELTLPLRELLLVDGGGQGVAVPSDTNPSRHSQEGEEEETSSNDPAATSAWQFMRNLRFHRRKGGRLLRRLDAHAKATGPPQFSVLPQELPRRPTPVYRRPAMNLAVSPELPSCPNEQPHSQQLVGRARRNRRTQPIPAITPYRQSLMLSVNQDNEIVVLPLASAAAHSDSLDSGSLGHVGIGSVPVSNSHMDSDTIQTSEGAGSNRADTISPPTAARSRLPSQGSGPPSYADSAEPS